MGKKRDPGIVKVGGSWHKLVLLPSGGVVMLKASSYGQIAELLRIIEGGTNV